MITLQIDRNGSVSLLRQIVEQIADAIRNGSLDAGSRLPPSRQLAQELGLNRNTVASAYGELRRLGLVASRVGHGTFVAEPANPVSDTGASASDSEPTAEIPWARLLARRCDRRIDMAEYGLGMGANRSGLISFDTAIPDPSFYPLQAFEACLHTAWREAEDGMLSYGPQEGYLPLRRYLAERLSRQGMAVDTEGLFIVNGSQQGLDMVGKLLLEPGDRVLMGFPTYPNAFRAFQLFDADIEPLPLDQGGPRFDRLDSAAAGNRIKFLYVMTNFQNPTGICLAEDRRRALLAWSRREGIPVVEDNFNAGLCYDGEEPVPLRGRPGGGEVIHLGTFSKILFPGIRLGWMVLPAAVRDTVRSIRGCTDLSTPVLLQRAMLEFCRQGHLDRHLEIIREVNRKRLETMMECMEQVFPAGVSWTRPRGGMTLWITLPANASAVGIFEEARAAGVSVAPGTLFFPGEEGDHAIRLSFIREPEERIREGIAILGKVIKSHLRKTRRREEKDTSAEVWL